MRLACLLVLTSVVFTSIQIAIAGPVDTERLDARLTRLVQEDGMIGLSVAIVENGQVTFAKGYGVTHKGGSSVNTDTKFRWASVSKGVAGTLAGVLAAEGVLDLKAPISNFTTTLKLPGNGQARATVEDVLSHRLGIVSNAYDTRLEDGRDPKDIREALGDLDNICEPGTCHTYQNVAFDTISEIVEDVTGQPFEDMVKIKLFDPLGMTNSSYGLEAMVENGNYARGHLRSRRWGDREIKLEEFYYSVPAAAGVNSSILDFATFMQAQMGVYNTIVPDDVLDNIHTSRIKTLREQRRMNRRYNRIDKSDYGLGWRIYDYEGKRAIGHRGGANGFRSLLLFDPELDSGVVALWNSTSNRPVGLQFEVMDMIYDMTREDWLHLDGAS